MATPLNVFKTITASLVDSDQVVYTAPLGITAIVLLAQASNVTDDDASITFSHNETTNNIQTELVKNFSVLPKDAASLITGKLVVEQNDEIKAFASSSGKLKLTLSLLESLNA